MSYLQEKRGGVDSVRESACARVFITVAAECKFRGQQVRREQRSTSQRNLGPYSLVRTSGSRSVHPLESTGAIAPIHAGILPGVLHFSGPSPRDAICPTRRGACFLRDPGGIPQRVLDACEGDRRSVDAWFLL